MLKIEYLHNLGRWKVTHSDSTEEYVTVERADNPVEPGTPINKALFDKIDNNTEYLIPSGLICMWSGSVVPDSWYLCDGQNGTPDLRDRFIVGAGSSYSVGNTGGEAFHTLTTNEMPSHNHNLEFPKEVYGTRPTQRTTLKTYNENTSIEYGDVSGNWSENYSVPLSNTGNGQAHENRPPYYALAFIMKA